MLEGKPLPAERSIVHTAGLLPRPSARQEPPTEREPNGVAPRDNSLVWAYGVTTVPARLDSLLPRTLQSLAAAGFDRPRLFVDGVEVDEPWRRFSLELTTRWPAIRTFANWFLALAELYLRNPSADRYAIFQDDIVCCRNLRGYLERCAFPARAYLNLYTHQRNQDEAPAETGWFASNQVGLGALALVFDRSTVVTLLSQQAFLLRPRKTGARHQGWKAIDDAIIAALRGVKYKEYCHMPSLVQHTGDESTMGNNREAVRRAPSFRGEAFDALTLP